MILYVDDEPRRVEPYREACELAGFEVDFLSDAGEVVDYLGEQRERVDLLILDVMMPMGSRYNRPEAIGGTLTGLEVYREVRQGHANLPILLFTQSYNSAIDRAIGADRCAAILRKQDTLPSDLPARIRDFLRKATPHGH